MEIVQVNQMLTRVDVLIWKWHMQTNLALPSIT